MVLTPCRAPLVPAFSFGENDLFDQVNNPRGSCLRRIQHFLQKIMGISLPLFHARGIFQYSFGWMPYRRPICTVGESIHRALTRARHTQAAQAGETGTVPGLCHLLPG